MPRCASQLKFRFRQLHITLIVLVSALSCNNNIYSRCRIEHRVVSSTNQTHTHTINSTIQTHPAIVDSIWNDSTSQPNQPVTHCYFRIYRTQNANTCADDFIYEEKNTQRTHTHRHAPPCHRHSDISQARRSVRLKLNVCVCRMRAYIKIYIQLPSRTINTQRHTI